MRIKLALILTAVVATPALAAIQWRGDFETGNLSQYPSKQMVAADRIQAVSSPVHEGSYAGKFTVIQGDDPINASGNRAELLRGKQDPEGSDVYYRWQTMFPSNYPSNNAWQLFAQWHQPEDYGSPPMQFYIYGEEMRFTLGMDQKLVWKTPFVRGVWHDFVMHVKFSDDASKGFVELWYDGQQVLPKTFGQTRANTWMKLGLYRAESISQTGVVYHDGWVLGDTYADVMNAYPTATPPATATTPPATTTPPTTTTTTTTTGTVGVGETAPVDGAALGMPDPNAPPGEPTGTVEYPLDDPSQQPGFNGEGAGQAGGCTAAGGSVMTLLGIAGAGMLSRRRRSKRL